MTSQRNRIQFHVAGKKGGEFKTASWIAPQDKAALQYYMNLLFGMVVPDRAVCVGHSSPLDALAASYFAEAPVVVWKASRGFGGKTTMLAGLSILELLEGADVNVLGGSGRQSQRVHEIESDAWREPINIGGDLFDSPLRSVVPLEPTTYKTETLGGNKLIALTASSASVRGPHPQRLRLDEVDEMDWAIYQAAMGQAMSRRGIPAQTTISSTMQYPDGTMAEVLKLAGQRRWPVFDWCYRETSVHNDGWLVDSEIADKRNSVTELMWLTEYELQEPSAEGLAFRRESVEESFDRDKVLLDRIGKYYELEPPDPNGVYVTAADWAKEQHTTVIVTLRYDSFPVKIVAFERLQKVSYPFQAERFNMRKNRYGGKAIHDATGVGSAMEDMVDSGTFSYKISNKMTTYSPYVVSLEQGNIEAPRIQSLYDEHKYVRGEDLFGRGHPPDGVVAMSLAWLIIAGKERGNKKRGKLHRPRILASRSSSGRGIRTL